MLLYRDIYHKAKDIDTKQGVVSFYFSDFQTVDGVGDRVDRKAFDKTLKSRDQRHHLLNHNFYAIIGKPIEIGTDQKGAYMVSQLSKTQLGQDTLTLYEEGIYNQHSFGYQVVKSHKEGKVRVLDEVKLYEASTVPFGANPNTPTISVKEIDALLKNNKLSENILEKLELLVNRLDASAPNQSDVKNTPDVKKEANVYDEFIKAINSYKK